MRFIAAWTVLFNLTRLWSESSAFCSPVISNSPLTFSAENETRGIDNNRRVCFSVLVRLRTMRRSSVECSSTFLGTNRRDPPTGRDECSTFNFGYLRQRWAHRLSLIKPVPHQRNPIAIPLFSVNGNVLSETSHSVLHSPNYFRISCTFAIVWNSSVIHEVLLLITILDINLLTYNIEADSR